MITSIRSVLMELVIVIGILALMAVCATPILTNVVEMQQQAATMQAEYNQNVAAEAVNCATIDLPAGKFEEITGACCQSDGLCRYAVTNGEVPSPEFIDWLRQNRSMEN